VTRSEVDVIVVGSGAAGLTAALSAQEHGARVAILECETVVGGSTRLSGGMIMAAGTDIQRAQGLQDDPEDLYQDYMLVNQFTIKPGIVRRLAYDGASTIAWLTDLGINFSPHVMQGGIERVPRSHVPLGGEIGGQHVVETLSLRCRERGIEIALGNHVDRLLVRDGAVVGVAVGGDEYEAGAVVLATGGFGANRELIAKHLPGIADYGDDWVFYIGPDSAQGRGLALAEQAGAAFVGHDVWVALPRPHNDGREFDSWLPGWMLVVGPDGRRLVQETASYNQIYGLARAAGDFIYGIFDARILADNGSEELPTFKAEFPPGTPWPPQVWHNDGLQRLLESGAMVQADTLEELAERLGIPAAAVAGSVARYNGFAAAGEDRDFHKPARWLRPIESPPFYGVPIRPSVLGLTNYGMEIDDQGQVLSVSAGEIDGLFAAGECTGGVLGTRYVGSGNSMANCVIFGRTAGRSAAAHALSQPSLAG
jgi:fumarate reductase flavoprotein subunit